MSINLAFLNDQVIGSTPSAMGSSPQVMMDDYPPIPKGTTVLPDEDKLGLQLLAALPADQQKIAMVSPTRARTSGTPAADFRTSRRRRTDWSHRR